MKKSFLLLSTFLLVLGFASKSLADDDISSLLQLLQFNEQSAKAALVHAVTGPSYFIPNVKALKNLPVQERVAMVQLAGKQAKAYLASPEFVAAYNTFRETRKPTPPEEPKYSRQLSDEHRANLQRNIDEMEKSKSALPIDQQTAMDGVINSLKQQVQELDRPDNKVFPADIDIHLKQAHAGEMAKYGERLAAWEQAYPADNPKPMIKQWLTVFLEKSADVDFEAQTTEVKPGVFTFINPEYERKDKLWKLLFRSGKDTVAAARTIAQEWLAELNQ
jgi:hypothetical protein